METQYGFQKMDLSEFKTYLSGLKVARTVTTVQQHHTYSPSYRHFDDSNHFTLQRNMKNYHVNERGWSDIGQHFTTYPDGTILTGRSLERNPAGIYGANSGSICIEHLGNFDLEGDDMSEAHREAIVGMTAALCEKFGIGINSSKVIYHHWYNLSNGKRNNGTGGNKSCPGTNFFGGNKVEHCDANFLPLVEAALIGATSGVVAGAGGTTTGTTPKTSTLPLKYGAVTVSKLNIRTGAGTSYGLANRDAATMGSILRVYAEKEGWYRISSSTDHWVYARYVKEVTRATVTAKELNVRSGPGTDYQVLSSITKESVVYIHEYSGKWGKIASDDRWVHTNYVE